MKLYRSTSHMTRWFAFSPATGWFTFPAQIDGWKQRQPAYGINQFELHEVPLRMGFNTGIPSIPGVEMSAGSAARLRLRVAA
jgi:hypothetical protein